MNLSSSMALTVAAALLLAACSGGGETESNAKAVDDNQSLSSLEDAAKEEGSLVLYSAFSEGPLQELVTVFEETYPEIKVEFTRKTTAELMQQFTSEAEAGINAVDVVTTASRDPIVAACEAGQFTEISGLPSAADFPGEFFDGCSAVVNVAPWGIWWNTDLVPAGETPKTYEDLLNPAWSGGKLGLPDPGNTDTYIWLFTVMEDSAGDGFLQQLRAQKPAYGPSGTPLVESVVAGSLNLMCCTPVDVVEPLKATGAPIDGIVPEPTMGSERTVGWRRRRHTRTPRGSS